ncbi:hypothetical protein [Bowmanella denitrificans]|uniref:hypothetical protein n=1 Tax=Bowmanella denitrificans TaxID=366582 RepID=UPI000C9CF9AE|nr:hypothetical protein [Bowmanella denitrificans]
MQIEIQQQQQQDVLKYLEGAGEPASLQDIVECTMLEKGEVLNALRALAEQNKAHRIGDKYRPVTEQESDPTSGANTPGWSPEMAVLRTLGSSIKRLTLSGIGIKAGLPTSALKHLLTDLIRQKGLVLKFGEYYHLSPGGVNWLRDQGVEVPLQVQDAVRTADMSMTASIVADGRETAQRLEQKAAMQNGSKVLAAEPDEGYLDAENSDDTPCADSDAQSPPKKPTTLTKAKQQDLTISVLVELTSAGSLLYPKQLAAALGCAAKDLSIPLQQLNNLGYLVRGINGPYGLSLAGIDYLQSVKPDLIVADKVTKRAKRFAAEPKNKPRTAAPKTSKANDQALASMFDDLLQEPATSDLQAIKHELCEFDLKSQVTGAAEKATIVQHLARHFPEHGEVHRHLTETAAFMARLGG